MRQRPDDEQERHLIEQSRFNADSFRELYHRYFPSTYAYVAYRLNRVQDVEDIVSEAFLKALEELHRFEYKGEGSFAAWLFRIVHNLVNDFYRRNPLRDQSVDFHESIQLCDATVPPDERLSALQESLRLRQLISTLSPRRQEVILLRFFGDLRNCEIAKVLGLNEHAVASYLCRGLEELRQKYLETTTDIIALGGANESKIRAC